MSDTSYVTPQIRTLQGAEIVDALGPVSAGSGKISIGPVGGDGTFRPNTNTCGTPLGYPCP